jgi:hypothetical protein
MMQAAAEHVDGVSLSIGQTWPLARHAAAITMGKKAPTAWMFGGRLTLPKVRPPLRARVPSPRRGVVLVGLRRKETEPIFDFKDVSVSCLSRSPSRLSPVVEGDMRSNPPRRRG